MLLWFPTIEPLIQQERRVRRCGCYAVLMSLRSVRTLNGGVTDPPPLAAAAADDDVAAFGRLREKVKNLGLAPNRSSTCRLN